MNDFWNDPPDTDLPECCGDEMDCDDTTGVCKCRTCGKTIEPDADDPEPLELMLKMDGWRLRAERAENTLAKWLEWARAHGHLEHAAGITADTRDILSNASVSGPHPSDDSTNNQTANG